MAGGVSEAGAPTIQRALSLMQTVAEMHARPCVDVARATLGSKTLKASGYDESQGGRLDADQWGAAARLLERWAER